MARRKKPSNFLGKMFGILTGKSKAERQHESIDKERERHLATTAQFLSMEYKSGKDPRTHSERQAAYDAAFRQLHGRPEPTHTRRQRVRDDHGGRSERGRLPSDDAGRHRRRHGTNEQRSRPAPETRHVQHHYPTEEQVAGQQAFVRQHSRTRRERDSSSRHGARHRQPSHAVEDQRHSRKSPARQPSNTARDGDSRSIDDSQHTERADTIVGLGIVPHAQQPNYTLEDGRSHHSVHMSDVLRSGSQRTSGSRQITDRNTKWSDFLTFEPVSPLSSPLPSLPGAAATRHHGERLPVCRMCETNPSSMDPRFSNLGYHLCTQCIKKAFKEPESPVSPVSPLTPARTSEARLKAFQFSDSARGRNTSDTFRNKGRGDARNLTGHAPVIQDPEIERQRNLRAQRAQASQDFNPWTSKAPLRQQNLSSGLNPALRDLSPDRGHLRHKPSSVYSVASDALPPSILPRATMGPSHRESQMIAPSILPPSAITHAIPETHAFNQPPPLPPRHALRESSSRPAAPAEVMMMPNHHRNTGAKPRGTRSRTHERQPAEGLRVQAQPSPSFTEWTADSYSPPALPPMPPVPAAPPFLHQEQGRKSQVRDTRFYKGFDDFYDEYYR